MPEISFNESNRQLVDLGDHPTELGVDVVEGARDDRAGHELAVDQLVAARLRGPSTGMGQGTQRSTEWRAAIGKRRN